MYVSVDVIGRVNAASLSRQHGRFLYLPSNTKSVTQAGILLYKELHPTPLKTGYRAKHQQIEYKECQWPWDRF